MSSKLCHTAVEHAKNGNVCSNRERKLTATTCNHKTLKRLVGLDDLNVLRELYSLLLAADTKILLVILLPNTDDSEYGKENRHHNSDRSDNLEPGRIVVTEDLVACKDGADKGDNTHTNHRTDGIEDGKEGTLVRIVGKNSLSRSGNRCLEGVADNPDCVNKCECGIACPHHCSGNKGCEDIKSYNRYGHDQVTDNHKGTELTELGIGLIHKRADNRIGNSIEHTHRRYHYRCKSDKAENVLTKGSNIAKN